MQLSQSLNVKTEENFLFFFGQFRQEHMRSSVVFHISYSQVFREPQLGFKLPSSVQSFLILIVSSGY